MKTTSELLFNEEPIIINKLAAKVIGLNESIVIQQIHYWLEINRKAKINFHDDRTWTYNSIAKWQKENFDFWSIDTVKRTFSKLVKAKILITGNYNEHGYDKTIWYTIDYEKLDNLLSNFNTKIQEDVEVSTLGQNAPMSDCNIGAECTNGLGQNAPMDWGNMHQPIPETNTETNTEISITTQSEEKTPPVVNTNIDLVQENTHLKNLSDNMKKKVKTFNTERLKKAIEIFKEKDGEYFSLLEKIYKDDKNFKPESSKTKKTKFHNFDGYLDKMSTSEVEERLAVNQYVKFGSEFEIKKVYIKALNLGLGALSTDDVRQGILDYAQQKNIKAPM